jgi:tetratricopeptide (TPR) repeat protein
MNGKERHIRSGSGPQPLSPANAVLLQQAQTLLQQRRRGEAALLYRKVLKSAPGNLIALFNLGKICHEARELDEAAHCFGSILKLKPGDPQALVALAFVRLDQKDMDGAQKLWGEARGQAHSSRLLVKFASHLGIMGRLQEAEQYLEEALAAQPDDVPAFQALTLVKKMKPGDAHVLRMLDIEKRAASLAIDDRIKLGFALGNIFLDAGDGDSAFPRLAEANRLKRSPLKYDIGLFGRYVDSIISLFDRPFTEKFRGAGGVRDDRPIFIVGMMRSGSTLTDQILSSHPLVASLGETDDFPKSLPVYANAEFPGIFPPGVTSMTKPFLDELTQGTLDGIGQKYLAATSPLAGKAARVTDKMLFNDLWTGMIRLALPESRMIHCTRDPVDTALSIWRILFIANIPWAYDMREIGSYYRLHMKLMDHWKSLFPGAIFEANYDAMVKNQEGESRKLLEHCGLPWDSRCLNFHETAGNVATASATQVRQPLYGASSGKWRKFEKHLQPMIDALYAGKAP